LLRPVRMRVHSVLSGGGVTPSCQHSLSNRDLQAPTRPVTNVECTFCPDVPLSLKAINSLALAVKCILYWECVLKMALAGEERKKKNAEHWQKAACADTV
jgi:hypothetical protein